MEQTQPSHQASTGTIIDTSTQRVVAALFAKYADSVEARSRLERHGFSGESLHIFVPADTPAVGREQQDLPVVHEIDRIGPVLTALGIPEDVASYYRVDVRAGMTLMTVVANERAQDVLNVIHGQGDEGMNQATEQVLQNISERSSSNQATDGAG